MKAFPIFECQKRQQVHEIKNADKFCVLIHLKFETTWKPDVRPTYE